MPKVVDDSIGPIGSICSSLLTLTQFQNLYGTGWVLMDGGSCAGSVYASVTGSTTVPDARGMVLRGKNNGRADGNQNPDGDSTLGTFQDHQYSQHKHSLTGAVTTNGGPYPGLLVSGGNGIVVNFANILGNEISAAMGNNGGNETRMRNITVNHFIRIN